MAVDPIEQFQIQNLFPVAKIGGTEIVFTNSAAFMLAAVLGLTFFLVGATASRGLIPSRLQSAAEIAYEFVATTVRSTAGGCSAPAGALQARARTPNVNAARLPLACMVATSSVGCLWRGARRVRKPFGGPPVRV